MALEVLNRGYADLRIDGNGHPLNPLVDFPVVGILKIAGVNVEPGGGGGGGIDLPLLLSKLRIMADGTLLLYNLDQNKFHALEVRGGPGAEYLTIGAGVS